VNNLRVHPFAVILALMLVTAPGLTGQASPRERLARALSLERDGQAEQAIAAIQALLDSKSLDTVETGQAWDILGLAYQSRREFASAQHAFEQSLRILENVPANARGYGMALDNFGGLLVALGQPEEAGRIQEKALHVFEKINDRASVAIVCSNLAALAFGQKQVRRGRKYLDRAQKEAQLASLDDDKLAAISSMRGWLSVIEGDAAGAVAAYQVSLDLWRKRYGEQHPSTGWGYVLLGDAKAAAGELTSALADMRTGLAVIERTRGRQDEHYLKAEIAYAGVLERSGARTEAAQLKTEAERELEKLHRAECDGCTISAAAFR
jgi:tetratricopeptide (TPR) repeat protein